MEWEMVSGTYGETVLHPLGLTRSSSAGAIRSVLSRRKAIVPLFIAAAAIPMSQRLVIFGADFTMLRILIIAYFARVIIRGEFRSIGWNILDTAMMLWSISGTVGDCPSRGLRGPHSSFRAVVGHVGLHFVGRFLIRSWSDVKFVGKVLAVLSLPVAVYLLLNGLPHITPSPFSVAFGPRPRCQLGDDFGARARLGIHLRARSGLQLCL